MQYVVSLSGGIASAVAAKRAIDRYGRRNVRLWFADTSWEDADLYRFMDDCMRFFGGRLYTFRDGRTPLEVAEQHSLIPNQKLAPCTVDLKIVPFTNLLWSLPKPVTVLLGLDWREMHRIHDRRVYHRKSGKPRRPVGYDHRIHGVYEDYPLLWKPLEYRPYTEVVESWGIAPPPQAYAMGFPHNNCGGRCVKQGAREWLRLRDTFPARFAEVRDWEQEQRAKGGARAGYAILRDQSGGTVKPVTLLELEQRESPQAGEPTQDDMFACFCSY